MQNCVKFHKAKSDFSSIFHFGFKLVKIPGWINASFHDDDVSDFVEITLEFASKEDANSFAENISEQMPNALYKA